MTELSSARSSGKAALLPGPFISYSRQDLDFARKLYDALRRRNRDAWVDLEGIEPSEEWLKKLYSAIDATQAFVFIISEASVGSRYCVEEINRAAENNKKLIPILYRRVAPEHLPSELAKLQWISFEREEHFESRVDDLVKALDTDLAWINQHTRLLVRAREWEAARDKSYLLRGKDLKDAEQWLLESANTKERQPTALHSAFIGASAEAQRKSRNRLFAGISAAAVIAVAFALIALYQRNQAERNERQAISRLLAAQAIGGMEQNFNLSLLLAVAAYRRAPTFEARQALQSAVETQPHLAKYFYGHSERIQHLAFDSSGTLVLSSSASGDVIVWNIDSGKEIFRARSESKTPSAVAISAEANRIAIVGANGKLQWHALTGDKSPIALAAGSNARISALAFSPDGGRIAWGGDDRRVTVLHTEQGARQCVSAELHKAPLTSLRFAGDGRSFASVDYAGTAILWNSETCEPNSVVSAEGGGPFAAISADLGQIAMTDAGFPEVRLGNFRDGVVKITPVDNSDFILALDFHPSGASLALGIRDARILLWDPSTNKTTLNLRGHRSDVTSVAFDPGGKKVASGSIHGEVIVWDLTLKRPMESARSLPQAAAASVFFTRDGKYLLAADQSGTIRSWDVGGSSSISLKTAWPASVTNVTINPNGTLAAARQNKRIVIQSLKDGSAVDELSLAATTPAQLRFSPDGRYLAFSDNGGVFLRDIQKHSTLRAGDTTKENAVLAFASKGDKLAFTSPNGSVSIFDVRSSETSRLPVPGHISYVSALALSHDGKLLATGGGMYDGNIILWNIADGRRLRVLRPEDPTDVAALFFTPYSESLVSVTAASNLLRLWDVASGRLIRSPEPLGQSPGGAAAAIHPDGKLLAIAQKDRIVLRDLNPESWMTAICRTVNRNLTMDEWRDYVGPSDYRPPCP